MQGSGELQASGGVRGARVTTAVCYHTDLSDGPHVSRGRLFSSPPALNFTRNTQIAANSAYPDTLSRLLQDPV